MTQNSSGLWTRMILRRKFTAVAAGFTLLMGGLILFNVMAMKSQSQLSLITDMTGRQRMLSQRYAKEVLLTAGGMAIEHQATLRHMRDSLAALMEGGEIIVNLDTMARGEVPPPPSPEIKARLADQAAALRLAEQAAQAYLALPAGDASRPARLKDLLVAQTQVGDAAESAVKLMSAHAATSIQTMVWLEALMGVVIAAIGLGISLFIGRQIAEPLEACASAARRMADGDLSLEPMRVRSSDEIGVLQTAFNQMVAGQRDTAQQARAVCDSLLAAAHALQSTAQEQAAGTKQQAAAVQEITTTVEEISRSGRQVAERARQVSDAADQVVDAGASGLQAVRDAATSMEAIREQTETLAETIVTLSERTQAAGEIVATVNEIAEQSNLVALNASIEAAGADAQGRRFAVVAGEMKNLADQAKDATLQVRGILEQTQKGINTSVMLTEEALKRVAIGHDRAGQSEQVIQRMAGSIEDSVNAFQQIVGATNQQQIGLEQVTHALQEIRQASTQTASSTAQLERAALDLGQLGQKLAQTLERYRL